MEITKITSSLASENPQDRLRGITALREYDASIAAPLLLSQVEDSETIVRSFAAMGLGHKRSEDGFNSLVQLLRDDADANVRSEAAGALAKYGKSAVPYLVEQFEMDQHWLLQMSILLAMPDLDSPAEFLQMIRRSRDLSEQTVQNTALEQLPRLADTSVAQEVLELLVELSQSEDWQERRAAALGLRAFSGDRVQPILQALRTDQDHRVVAATLEGTLSR